MGVLKEVEHHPDEFLSPIFLVPKKDGEYRMILNLKTLNESITYHHFKMDTFEIALKLIKPNCYMASVDLRHAYYSINVAESQQVKLRFVFSDKIYQYTCLPNGISCAPRLFTKLLKPVFSTLRQLGHSNSGFIDDSLLVAETFPECQENVSDTVGLMTELGFIVHPNKSVLVPTQDISFLGNDIYSRDMTVTLPQEKVKLIVQECSKLREKHVVTIRVVARILGLMVSTFTAVEYGPLHYRNIEREKIEALKSSRGDFDGLMLISGTIKSDLQWWIDNLAYQKRYIDHGNPDYLIITDASLLGWGAVFENERIGGRWSETEAESHINVLEMTAVFLALKAFCNNYRGKHVRVKSDNNCTVSYLNAMGGVKSQSCNKLSVQIWSWCIERNLWLSAAYLPGADNMADYGSRNFKNENVEWMLDKDIFKKITQHWSMPEVDMFASRLNKQLEHFVSWKPHPDALYVNAFSVDWSSIYFYGFPPFSIISRCLQKVLRDSAECILVVPLWTTQPWYTELMTLLIDYPLVLPRYDNLLTMGSSDRKHPLIHKLQLMACRLSGDRLKTETFQSKQPIFCSRLGAKEHKNSISHTLKSGLHSVVRNRLIQFKQI